MSCSTWPWYFICKVNGTNRVLDLKNKILSDTSYHYINALLFYVFEVCKAKSATQSVLMVLTLNGLFQKNSQVFYFTPENPISHICLFFFNYSVCTVISDCNHPFETSTFSHTVLQEYIIAIENTDLNGGFLKSKISIFS